MNGAAAALLALSAGAAVVDWAAVLTKRKTLEYWAKPAVMVFLVAAAAAIDGVAPPGRRTWILVALVCCLAGDIFLMLPSDRFVEGLASFLLGHLAYVVAFTRDGEGWSYEVIAMAVLIAGLVGVLAQVARGAARQERALGVAVGVYGVTIMAMALAAAWSGSSAAAIGAVLFMASDALIGWNRFVQSLAWAPITIIVTYHLAQFALVLSLLQA